MHKRRSTLLMLTLSSTVLASSSQALTLDELKDMSLDQLADVKVSIASKTPQKISESAAAVYLITREDIRRSGATTLPELLRTVPGMNVASINGNTTAVSARGFHDFFSNKFLVMMDGRSLYTPLFSGMYWDVQDLDFGDIERIEIIRGPGAAVWGANAMNGVINIITRSALDSDEQRLTAIAGSEEKIASFSTSHTLSADGAVRVWGKWRDNDEQKLANGDDAHDAWHQGKIGFRSDHYLGETDTLSVDGAYFQGESDHTLELVSDLVIIDDTEPVSGAHLMTRWSRQLDNQSLSAHLYIDHQQREDMRVGQRINTIDVALQHTTEHNDKGSFTWGLNHRYVSDATSSHRAFAVGLPAVFALDPASKRYHSSGISFQEEYWFSPEFKLLAGVRFDHHDLNGWEAQPSLRALWRLAPEAELWAALSRSVRTPSRFENHIDINTPLTTVTSANPTRSEKLTSLELGARIRPSDKLSLNGALFYNRYEDLASLTERQRVPITLPGPGGIPIPAEYSVFQLGNDISATSYGAELDARYNINASWRMKLSYSWMKVDSDDITATRSSAIALDNLPTQQLYVNSSWDLTPELELDASLYYVDKLKESKVDAYTRFDLRLGWIPRPDLELSLTGKNLFDSQHAEYSPPDSNYTGGINSSEMQRSVTAKAVWRF